jgi:hypothetical protein
MNCPPIPLSPPSAYLCATRLKLKIILGKELKIEEKVFVKNNKKTLLTG